MKVISRIGIVVVVALVVAASVQLTSAVCSTGVTIQSFGGGGSAYISSPGDQTASSVGGAFWSLGQGNPAPLLGHDNGTDLATGNVEPQDDWLRFYGAAGMGVAATWATGSVDGCISGDPSPLPKRNIVLITDSTAADSFMLVMCKEADAATANYYVGLLGPAALVPIPYPRVLTSSRVVDTSVTVNVGSPAAHLTGAILADPSCPANLITGYKLYTQVRPNASGEPTDRARGAGWQQQGGVNAIAADAPPLVMGCANQESVYVATSLMLDSGFETAHVSQHVRVPCDPSLADRPGNFKIIKKPGAQERRR